MAGASDPAFDTLALHAGAAPDPTTGARAVPLHLTTSFVFESSEQAASLFNLERSGHVYSRISNPTSAVFEERIAALEGGVGAIATASGQAALHLAIATLAGAGAHIVSSSALYGGSHNLLHYTLRRFGIATTFVKPGDIDGWRAAIRPETKLLFGETLGNPGLDVLDIPTVSAIAHDAGLPLLVDSTFTTPWLMQPFEHGADLLYHSATKFLSGHGTVIGGVLVDSGAFDWEGSQRFPELTQPYDGFHGMVFSEERTSSEPMCLSTPWVRAGLMVYFARYWRMRALARLAARRRSEIWAKGMVAILLIPGWHGVSRVGGETGSVRCCKHGVSAGVWRRSLGFRWRRFAGILVNWWAVRLGLAWGAARTWRSELGGGRRG